MEIKNIKAESISEAKDIISSLDVNVEFMIYVDLTKEEFADVKE